jgi:hypothetical protein
MLRLQGNEQSLPKGDREMNVSLPLAGKRSCGKTKNKIQRKLTLLSQIPARVLKDSKNQRGNGLP